MRLHGFLIQVLSLIIILLLFDAKGDQDDDDRDDCETVWELYREPL